MERRFKNISIWFIFGWLCVFQGNAQIPELQWAVQFAGTGENTANAVVRDANGNIYTTGLFNGTVDFDPGANDFELVSFGERDIYISKMDGNGNLIWVNQIGGIDRDSGETLAIDHDGNLVVVGYFKDVVDFDPGPNTFFIDGGDRYNMFILKIDLSGNFIWAKNIEISNSLSLYLTALTVDDLGNIYTTGQFRDIADFDPGPGIFNLEAIGFRDVFVSKLDTDGNFVWARGFGSSLKNCVGKTILVDNDYNVITGGNFEGDVDFDPGGGQLILETPGNNPNMYLLKLNSIGDFVWVKQIESTGANNMEVVLQDDSGHIFYAGTFLATADFDPGPGVYNLTSAGIDDIVISKLDATGNLIWVKQYEGSGNDGVEDLNFDIEGNIIAAGSFQGSIDFDPGPQVFSLTCDAFTDGYVSKLSPSGDFIYAAQFDCDGSFWVGSFALSDTNDIYLSGGFSYDADFDPGVSQYILDAHADYETYVVKLNDDVFLNMGDYNFDPVIDIYPNPVEDLLTIRSQDEMESITIFNVLGEVVFFSKSNGVEETIELGGLPSGFYLVAIATESTLKKIRMIKS